MDELRTAHLFAGGGGGLLADLILGHQPVLAVELEESCCRSLRARVQEGWLPSELHIHCGDVREFDFSAWAGRVDCISAGFPCQDISCAGSGKGIEGARSGLVWEVFRAIDAIRPGLVFLENSPEIRTKGRRDIISALVERGYSWRDGTLAAATVGAGHLRNRWWLLAANTDGMRKLEQERSEREQWGWVGNQIASASDVNRIRGDGLENTPGGNHNIGYDTGREKGADWDQERIEDAAYFDSERCDRRRWPREEENRRRQSKNDAADALCQRLQISVQRGGLSEASADSIQAAAGYTGAYHWSPPDAGICGMVDGLAPQMDGCTKGSRIKACGNGQVPLAAAAAWLILSGNQS